MRVLKKGVRGDDVAQWELFLHGAGFTFTKPRDNVFDAETEKLTQQFQKKNKLVPDGIVGNATFGAAMSKALKRCLSSTSRQLSFLRNRLSNQWLGTRPAMLFLAP